VSTHRQRNVTRRASAEKALTPVPLG
jgi:hypothetical protein